jgi:condensin complex subunit 3
LRENGLLENGESGVKQLLNAEQALYFRVLCSTLDSEAQVKRSEAASTGGAQATVYAAVAADNVEALEMILPPTVAAYVGLVNAHLCAGPQHRFAARQLLLLANLLDFSDSANHKAAGTLVHSLLQEESSERGIASETDPDVVIGDALSLGRDKEWADAVARLAVQVHAEQGEYEKVMTDAIVVLGQPCREGGAQVSQWLHCLAVTSLLLEHLKSIQWLSGCAIGAQEIVDALLLVAAKHFHPEVQKAGVRCLGLFQLLASKPSMSVVTQLRRSLLSSFETVQIMAVKATFDVLLWCGAASLDRVMGIGIDLAPVSEPSKAGVQVPPNHPVSVIGDDEMVMRKPLMELLMNLLESAPIEEKPDELVESETVGGLVAEGFAKVLLQSKAFKDVQTIEDILFAQLICLYFNGDMNISPRFVSVTLHMLCK